MVPSKAIADIIKKIYSNLTTSNEPTLNQNLEDNVFAVTMKFDSVEFDPSESKRDPETYLNRYRGWFTPLIIQAFGNNIGRKRYQQPLSVSYVDFPGSKGTMSSNQAANFLNYGLLHVHAVIAVRPGDGEAFRRPLLVAGSAHQLRRFGEVKVEPFDPGKGSLENMVEYCSKGAKLIGPHHRSNCYEFLPR